MTTEQIMTKVRENFRAVRTMKRNLRLDRYQGRNNGGDYAYQERIALEALATLPRELQGLLTAEHKLAERISENKDLGQDRPELRERLNRTRREIKAAL